jgi:magnesium chelatase subunit I
MSEDDGQEDKVVGRLLGEAVKNIFDQHLDLGQFRSVVEYFENGKSLEVGDQMPSAEYSDHLAAVPGFKKLLLQSAQKLAPDLADSPARDALIASVAEFVLESLHVHNKLNKNEKAGKTIYRR